MLDFEELATHLDHRLDQYKVLERSFEDSLVKIQVLEEHVQARNATIEFYENQLSHLKVRWSLRPSLWLT